jgi:hypothetical protein
VHASVTHAFLAQKPHGNCTPSAQKLHGNVHRNCTETCTETAHKRAQKLHYVDILIEKSWFGKADEGDRRRWLSAYSIGSRADEDLVRGS